MHRSQEGAGYRTLSPINTIPHTDPGVPCPRNSAEDLNKHSTREPVQDLHRFLLSAPATP